MLARASLGLITILMPTATPEVVVQNGGVGVGGFLPNERVWITGRDFKIWDLRLRK